MPNFPFLNIAITILYWLSTYGLTLESAVANDTGTYQKKVNEIDFQIAAGLELQLVAAPPLIKWPIVADWDIDGRLVVAESGGVQRPVAEHNLLGLHKIVRLIDEDNDGVFDQRMVAAEGLGFPEGVLCLGKSILVSIPPEIIKLTDLDGDGFCEEKETWFDGQTITGCANDLHGPYFGRDGKIYWCKGAFAEQHHLLADGQKLSSSAAHLYRCNEDGTQLEIVMTGGMDNPVEVAFIPEGEKFFTSTFLQHPSEGRRDGIAHAIYGGLFGKEHDVLQGHSRTGDLMPIMTHLGPAAPSGLIYLEKDELFKSGSDDRSRRLCAALFNLHKVTLHRLRSSQSSYTTVDSDLIATDQVDFHPTDVIEDADGSILVVDTGGWYDLCCPTSRIDQKTALGGIYRINNSYTRSSRREVLKLSSPTHSGGSIELLQDPRPWVQRSTIRRFHQAEDKLLNLAFNIIDNPDKPTDQRMRYLWAIGLSGQVSALQVCDSILLSDQKALIKVACHVIALHGYHPSRAKLEQLLTHQDVSLCRVAAEAIGRLGNPISFRAILESPHLKSDDRHVRHSLLYAMIEIIKKNPDFVFPTANLSETQLAALIWAATECDKIGQLERQVLARSLAADDLELQDAAFRACCRSTDLVKQFLPDINTIWMASGSSASTYHTVLNLLATSKDQLEVSAFIYELFTNAPHFNKEKQRALATHLEALSPANVNKGWCDTLLIWITKCPGETQTVVLKHFSNLNIDNVNALAVTQRLLELVENETDPYTRLLLLNAIPSGNFTLPRSIETEVINQMEGGKRGSATIASQIVNRVKISVNSSNLLVEMMERCQPQYLPIVIEAILKCGDTQLATVVLNKLQHLSISRTLSPGYLTNTFRNAPESLRNEAQKIEELIEAGDQDIRQAVNKKLSYLSQGNALRGLQLFRSSKLACSGCNKMGYVGNEIGPDLTRIGKTRTREALLKAILYPSSRIEQGYATTKI
ncbi:MAG: hypothetical protein VXZ38_04740, partial [Planctomycetota bacterium]|nr:hypothetical protein [Planctomycetota bacterium]